MDRWQRAATSTVTVARGAANSGAAKLAVAGHNHTARVNTITWATTTKKQSYTTARRACNLRVGACQGVGTSGGISTELRVGRCSRAQQKVHEARNDATAQQQLGLFVALHNELDKHLPPPQSHNHTIHLHCAS